MSYIDACNANYDQLRSSTEKEQAEYAAIRAAYAANLP